MFEDTKWCVGYKIWGPRSWVLKQMQFFDLVEMAHNSNGLHDEPNFVLLMQL